MSGIWPEVFRRPEPDAPVDPEHDLYGGFVGNADRRRLTQLRALDPAALRAPARRPALAELLAWRARTWLEAAQWSRPRPPAGRRGRRPTLALQERLPRPCQPASASSGLAVPPAATLSTWV
jgi:exodeoxyribonuclease-1